MCVPLIPFSQTSPPIHKTKSLNRSFKSYYNNYIGAPSYWFIETNLTQEMFLKGNDYNPLVGSQIHCHSHTWSPLDHCVPKVLRQWKHAQTPNASKVRYIALRSFGLTHNCCNCNNRQGICCNNPSALSMLLCLGLWETYSSCLDWHGSQMRWNKNWFCNVRFFDKTSYPVQIRWFKEQHHVQNNVFQK